MSEIAKTYESAAVEAKWYAFWLRNECFTADPARVSEQRPAYSIVIPPPNVTGVLTLGHVLNVTIQDILARRARMLGKEVLWLPGTDHAGIATQNVVEKALRKSGEIKHRDDLGREGLVAKIWEWKDKYGGIILQQLRALGASCDWSRTRFTMDAEYSRCVARVFVDLYKKGLIYRGKRMVNWCPASLTALSDEEVIMKEQNGVLYYFRVEVLEAAGEGERPRESQPGSSDQGSPRRSPSFFRPTGRFLTIATTRPETIPGDTAIAVNPRDPRYAGLIGQHARRPLPRENQAPIPIIGDDAVAFDFGTGVLKVTPAHDKTDHEIGQRHALPMIDIMHPNGVMNALAGADFAGLERFEARQRAVELLAELGALEKEEPYKNNVGHSERADVPIEPRLSEQWFLKYPSVKAARRCVERSDLLDKSVRIVVARDEFAAPTIDALRDAALAYARGHGMLGRSFKNDDSGIELRVRRKSLSHAFSNRGEANIKAVAILPELIRTALYLGSEPHDPPHPRFQRVHRFLAAAFLGGELYSVHIVGKELIDGSVLYDHKTRGVAPGGKSLVAHLREEKLGSQPAPGATMVIVRELLASVNESFFGSMKFQPPRWAKVYDHWLGGLQDWCISRQLWWGHRIPVWYRRDTSPAGGNLSPVTSRPSTDTKTPSHATPAPSPAATIPSPETQNPSPETTIPSPESTIPSPVTTNLSVSSAQNSTEADVYLSPTQEDSPIDSIYVGVELPPDVEQWTQDPDVLDTWFSSWLWPFATMGWPEKTDTLAKFYPTTDLVTGPDIIFFWVARMIMAGFEWMGGMPFQNVYFTGIIRDKQGRKMSKSLGNSPDPLDLIAKFGADALRFGVMRSAPLGADILFDDKNVELGRNFCTKLWNAARFRQMQGGETEGEIDPALLTSDDKWLLLRLDAAIREVSTALDQYRFSDAAGALHRFFWSEYCDWYLEASKASLLSGTGGPPVPPGIDEPGARDARKANTLAVMDFVLAHTLRLMHPFLPFITEELWHGLGFHEDLPAKRGGETIIFALWPAPLDDDFKAHYGLDSEAEQFANAKYEVVNFGRGLRRDFNIPSSKRVRFVFRPATPLPAHEAEVLKILLNADPLDILANYAAPVGTPTALSPLGELLLPLEGLIDVAAERERLKKEVAKVEDELARVSAKLADPNFAAKVPAKVLDEHRQRATAWSEKRGQLAKMLAALGDA